MIVSIWVTVPQYRAVLATLSNYQVMPVLAFDRHPDHNVAALDFVKSRPGTDVGIRLQMIDIESYNLTKSNLQALWADLVVAKPQTVILLIDLRIIDDAADSKRKVERFVASFQGDFPGAKVVVSGSVVPASIAGLLPNKLQGSYSSRGIQAVAGYELNPRLQGGVVWRLRRGQSGVFRLRDGTRVY